MNRLSTMAQRISASKEVKASSAYVICSVLQKCLSFFTLPGKMRTLLQETIHYRNSVGDNDDLEAE